MTCKSRRSGAACLRNGMRIGVHRLQGGVGAGWLRQQVLGEREREGLIQAASKANGRQSNFL